MGSSQLTLISIVIMHYNNLIHNTLMRLAQPQCKSSSVCRGSSTVFLWDACSSRDPSTFCGGAMATLQLGKCVCACVCVCVRVCVPGHFHSLLF